MTSLVRWEPFHEINNFRDTVNRMWEHNYGFLSPNGGNPDWIFPVDMHENSEAILLQAEIPGLKREDISLNFRDNVLTIRGERKCEECEDKEASHLRSERHYGSFCRSFVLGVPIDGEQISASYRDGVLHVRLPKQENAKERKIEISLEN
ncbi:MAG: Hsp20/alpha crystallin family protein [Clostridia bacterium]|nr:Hsp20/alpha crystallin family protein [Clostridia bacterium]